MVAGQDISVSVKAAIVEAGRVIVVEYDQPDLHYNLPGGRVRTGESLREAVVRKASEETGVHVVVGVLLFVVEYVPSRWDHEFGDQQKVQFTFLCSPAPESPPPSMPEEPDFAQTDVRWADLEELSSIGLLPRVADRLLLAVRADTGLDPLIDEW